MRIASIVRIYGPLAAAIFAQPLVASAQEFIKPGDETFTLDVGGIVSNFGSSVTLNGQGRSGTNIDLEGAGLKHQDSTLEAMATWRFFPRHRVDATYFGGTRSGSRTIDRDFVIGGITVPVNTTLSAEGEQQFVFIDYRYSFMKTDQMEFAGLLGVYGGQYKFKFTSNSPKIDTTASTTVPLPMIGASLDWTPSPRWTVSAMAAGMSAKVGDVDGKAFLAGVSADYMLTRNFGLGLGYRYLDISADVTKSSFNGSLDYRTSSARAYAQFKF